MDPSKMSPTEQAAYFAKMDEVAEINAHTAAATGYSAGEPVQNVVSPSAFQRARRSRMARVQKTLPDGTPAKAEDHLLYFEQIDGIADTNDFVEGLLIDRGMSVIYGESNSGKTFFATDLAFHVACGWPWNGRETTKGAVLYCCLEGSHGIRNRVVALKKHYSAAAAVPFVLLPTAVDLLNSEQDTSEIIDAIRAIKARLGMPVIFTVMDTLSRAMAGGNENAPDDMGALVANGTRIQQEGETHLAWIHHCGKDAAKGARGHSLLRAATDTEIEVTASGAAHVALVTKQRDLDCIGEFPFTLKVIELGQNKRGKPITSCVVDFNSNAPAGPGTTLRRLNGHSKRAYELLVDACATAGQSGHPGAPANAPSVPEQWWRERFYNGAMAGAEQDTKKKAFQRVAADLINRHLVGMANKRVWPVSCGVFDGAQNAGTYAGT